MLAAINVDVFPDGATINLDPIFGNSVIFDDSGDVSGAKAMFQVTTHQGRMEGLRDEAVILGRLWFLASRSVSAGLEAHDRNVE